MLHEEEKNRKLTDLLDALDFNQVQSVCAVCLMTVTVVQSEIAGACMYVNLSGWCHKAAVCVHGLYLQLQQDKKTELCDSLFDCCVIRLSSL